MKKAVETVVSAPRQMIDPATTNETASSNEVIYSETDLPLTLTHTICHHTGPVSHGSVRPARHACRRRDANEPPGITPEGLVSTV